ncbi:hypothetical protein [Streptomyces sp. NPDC005423]|uniref:hypothetical protein n=1 Tax=Streptomyces sp. NPDC005423 TaxID=3155343 RepID=UPI0033B48972
MSDAFRRLADRLMGRSRSARNGGAATPEVRDPAPGGPDHAQNRGSRTFGRDDVIGYYAPDRENYAPDERSYPAVGGQEAGRYGRPSTPGGDERAQAPTADPPWMSSSEEAAFERMAKLQSEMQKLSPAERAASEDRILHMVREDPKWKRVHDKYPERMPVIMTYANNAYARELGVAPPPAPDTPRPDTPPLDTRAERWERDPPRAEVPWPPSFVVRDLEAAAERIETEARGRWEREAPRSKSVAPSEVSSSYPAPGDMSDGVAFTHVWREQERLSNNPPPASRSPEQYPVSPLVEHASPAWSEIPPPLIGDAGREVLGSQAASVHQAADHSSNPANRNFSHPSVTQSPAPRMSR